ncbi:Bug family tripartite tricarboxylate transporter substrate binding protein [Variovorax sp. RB2P76]|uniref:Bug family tripartite tricarboxylate transporter substrate binding protein n=1 Tax=Variovorax sp. RB2P76 TaxID=3443736 RepID=UPI003F4461CC
MRPLRPLRKLRVLACGALVALAAAPGHAQGPEAWPDKPVTLVVPTAAAGGTDTIARLIADALGKTLKQTFIVDNRPGANGILGADLVARGTPDGYRLLFTYAAAMVVNPSLYKKLPYDPVKDFAPVAQVGRGGNLLLVRNDLPVKTLKDFVAYAKARPDKLSYCSWGNGSGGHLAMESLKKQAGLVMMHVPYKGSGPCVQDLLGGQVDAAFADMSSTVEIVRAGRLKALANSGPSRIPMLPDVPTMTEVGYPFTTYAWYGLLAPAKTPPAVVKKLNEAVNQALKDPAVVRRLRELNFTDLPQNTPEQFAETIQQDLRDWGTLVKDIGLTLE